MAGANGALAREVTSGAVRGKRISANDEQGVFKSVLLLIHVLFGST
jgi:hypothetical protein